MEMIALASQDGRPQGDAYGDAGQRRVRRASTRRDDQPTTRMRRVSQSDVKRRSTTARQGGQSAGTSRTRAASARSDAQRSSRSQASRSQSGARRSQANARRSNPAAVRQRAARKTQRRAAARQAVRTAPARARARREALGAPALGAIAFATLLVLLLLFRFLRIGITVNGEKVTVWRGTTIERILDKEIVTPKPGNLVAVDGSVITEGGGRRCSAKVNGETAGLKTRVKRGAEVKIGDGRDVEEKATETEQTIPCGTMDSDRSFGAYWYGSIHLLSDGQDGVEVERTGKKSGKTVTEVKTPAVPKGYCVYTAKPEDKVVALTFDDGPWPETTSQILDILEENGAKATFFTIGNQIAEVPDQVKRAHEMGCEVCTHSWDHAAGSGGGVNLTFMSSQEQIDEVQKGYAAIKEVLGEEPPHIMRAPGGNFFDSIIDTLWPYVDAEIGWDVDTEDWSLPGADHIEQMILSVEPGQVILMHDGGGDRTQTVEALRAALPKLKEEGYSFVTVDELLAYGIPGEESSVIDVG